LLFQHGIDVLCTGPFTAGIPKFASQLPSHVSCPATRIRAGGPQPLVPVSCHHGDLAPVLAHAVTITALAAKPIAAGQRATHPPRAA
jgi:hypothetical protein